MSDGLKHTWDWFDLHAKQRMQTINFYILVVAALLAGTGAAFTGGQYLFAGLLGLLLVLASALFFAMDQRARQLIFMAEEALKHEEQKLSEESGTPAYNFIEQAWQRPRWGLSYGAIFRVLFVSIGFAGVVIAAYSWGVAAPAKAQGDGQVAPESSGAPPPAAARGR